MNATVRGLKSRGAVRVGQGNSSREINHLWEEPHSQPRTALTTPSAGSAPVLGSSLGRRLSVFAPQHRGVQTADPAVVSRATGRSQDDRMYATTTDDRTDLQTDSRVLQGGYSGGLCPREVRLYTPPERPHEKKISRTCRLAIPGGEGLKLLARSPPRNDPPVGNSGRREVVAA